MAAYVGWAEILDAAGAVLDHVSAELWSEPGKAGAERWSGDLLPIGRRSFAPGVPLVVGQLLALRLPNGRAARCEVERVRNGEPALMRIGGRGAAPFG